MAWWISKDVELKQKSKFIVSFAETFFLPNIKSCSKPSLEINTKEYKLLNHNFNYPGIVKWNPVRIVFVDMNGGGGQFDTAAFMSQMLNNSGYNYPNGGSHALGSDGADTTDISSPEKASTIANAFGGGLSGAKDNASASERRQNVLIQLLTPDGNVNEKWTLVNPLIKSMKFGDLTYEDDSPIEYEIEIAYDFAIYG